jgi:hypothetical protein
MIMRSKRFDTLLFLFTKVMYGSILVSWRHSIIICGMFSNYIVNILLVSMQQINVKGLDDNARMKMSF